MSTSRTAARLMWMSGALALALIVGAAGCRQPARTDVDQEGQCVRPPAGGSGRDFGQCMRNTAFGQMPGSADTSMLACHDCDPPNRNVRMVLSAVRGARTFNVNAVDPANSGKVVARIQNIDTVRFVDLRLDAEHTAYWWWHRRGPNQPPQSMLYIVNAANDVVDSLALSVSHCQDPQSPNDQAEWNRQHPPERCTQLLSNNSWWISCLNGCCSGSRQQ